MIKTGVEERVIQGSRRSLNAYEADRIIQTWLVFFSDDEPLHVFLGWTESELLEYQINGLLPI